MGSFPFAPQLSGCLLFAPTDARALFLHNVLLCNDTCSATGEHNVMGGTNGKDPQKVTHAGKYFFY